VCRRRRVLAGIELFTGVAGLAGGLLLAAAPDGSLLNADPAVLVDSPFTDWRAPGILLASLVGGGYLVTSVWQWRAGRGARWLSALAGIGLVAFEGAELIWLGFQPLEAVFAIIGTTVTALALTGPRQDWPGTPSPSGADAVGASTVSWSRAAGSGS